MALLTLIKEGIKRTLEKERADFLSAELNREVREAGLMAVCRLPDALQALCELEWREDTPLIYRTLLPVVTTYMFQDDNLIPAREGQILAGILDDAYLAFAACCYAADSGVAGSLEFQKELSAIAALLPAEIASELDQKLEEALADAREAIEKAHLEEVL